MKFNLLFRALFAGACAVLLAAQVLAADSPREHLSLDANWKFHLGDDWPNARICPILAPHRTDHGTVQRLGVAHGQFAARLGEWNCRSTGMATRIMATVRSGRTFRRTASPGIAGHSNCRSDSGKRIWLTFDGAFRDTTVWVNGWLVRQHEGGYNPFREDITDVVRLGGRNTIAVRVDATKFEGWFYEGAGIYRHVWLDKTAPVAIAPDGIFVY